MADDYLNMLQSIYSDTEKSIDEYTNRMIGIAEGDLGFALEQLDRQHELALGSDDQARAQFFESVADKLEERIGRIPYDYQQLKGRTIEDYQRTVGVTERDTSSALARLAEDEQVWKQEFGKETDMARQGQREELSARGILQGTREQAGGIAGREVGQLEGEIGDRLSAYDRALGRQREDIGTQKEDILFEAGRNKDRTLEDLKTQARRGGIDAQDTYKFGTEAERRAFEKKKAQLEEERKRQKLAGRSFSVQLAGQQGV